MSIKTLNEAWVCLNDGASAARHRFDTTGIRDADENPWTDDDRILQHCMLQEMATRANRIEERQEVLYQLQCRTHERLTTFAIVAGIAVLAGWLR